MINWIKKNYFKIPSWLRWAGVTAGVMLITAIGLQFITPPATPTPETILTQKNYNNSVTEFQKVKFVGEPPIIPNTLATYHGRIEPVTKTIQIIKKKFNLSQVDQDLWQGPEYSLVYISDLGLFNLSVNQADEADRRLPTIKQNQAINLAQELINNFFPKQKANLSLVVEKINYLRGFPELTTTNGNQATHMLIPFSYKLDFNLPVFTAYDQYLPIKVLIDSNRKLKKLEFKDALFSFYLNKKLKTLSVNQAINNINHGVGSILYASSNDLEPLDLSIITQAILNKAELEYRLDSEQNNLTLPFYHFYGRAKNKQGKDFQIEIITPAVKR